MIILLSIHVPVGVYIAILALVGVLVPLLREKVGKREKAFWTLFLTVLLILELRSIYRDRDEHDRAQTQIRNTEQQRFDQTMNRFDVIVASVQEVQRTTIALGKARAQSRRIVSLPQQSLKKRATDLSVEILEFMTNRQAGDPPLNAFGEEGKKQMQEKINYLNATIALYHQFFGVKVDKIRDEFAKRGIVDTPLDRSMDHPVTTYQILDVAERLGVMAANLQR